MQTEQTFDLLDIIHDSKGIISIEKISNFSSNIHICIKI